MNMAIYPASRPNKQAFLCCKTHLKVASVIRALASTRSQSVLSIYYAAKVLLHEVRYQYPLLYLSSLKGANLFDAIILTQGPRC